MLRTSLCIRTTPHLTLPLHVPLWPLNAPRSKKVSSKGKTQASGRALSAWQLIVMGLEGNVRQKKDELEGPPSGSSSQRRETDHGDGHTA